MKDIKTEAGVLFLFHPSPWRSSHPSAIGQFSASLQEKYRYFFQPIHQDNHTAGWGKHPHRL
jgi:hypothetical protein